MVAVTANADPQQHSLCVQAGMNNVVTKPLTADKAQHILFNDLLEAEQSWLDKEIYGREGASRSLPMLEVSAFKRYSHRAELME